MKKIKLMSLLTALLLVLGFTASHAQGVPAPPPNSFTRPTCLSGFAGCVENSVTLKFAMTSTGLGSTTPFPVTAPNTYSVASAFKYVAASLDGVSYTAYQKIPSTLADPIVFTLTAPTNPYLVSITLTTANTYTIGVSHNAL